MDSDLGSLCSSVRLIPRVYLRDCWKLFLLQKPPPCPQLVDAPSLSGKPKLSRVGPARPQSVSAVHACSCLLPPGTSAPASLQLLPLCAGCCCCWLGLQLAQASWFLPHWVLCSHLAWGRAHHLAGSPVLMSSSHSSERPREEFSCFPTEQLLTLAFIPF